MNSQNQDLQHTFQSPPNSFRGTELWMLNDRLDDQELRFQIREMSEKGFYSFIARTYIGLKSDYPGPQFMARMKTIIEAAREYGMKVFLQAGYMPEAVLDLPPEYAMQHLTAFRAGEGTDQGDLLCSHDGIDYRAVSSQTVLDMFNPAAMKFYMKQSYEDLWIQFEAEFGQTILSVWVDEPSYKSAHLPWSSALPDVFRSKWQYNLAEKLYLLFADEDGCETVRYHYWQTVLEMMKNAYFTEVRSWCHAHNLLFSGHLMMEDTLQQQISRACCVMPFYKYFDIPGIDYLTAEMNWRFNPLPAKDPNPGRRFGMVNTPLQCSSAAHQAGKSDVLCEMYGVSSQNLTFRDQKNMFDHFASLGINHKCVHGIFYSLRGRGKRAYPPHVNYYQPYWEQYRTVTDYCARASWFISQGQPVRDILVIHPIDSAFCEYHGPTLATLPNDALATRDANFYTLLQNLLAGQHDFELGDEDTIRECGEVQADGRFRVGAMAYRTIILPDLLTLQPSTLRLLEDFARQGGKIIVLGHLPVRLNGWRDNTAASRLAGCPGLAQVADYPALDAVLRCQAKEYQFTGYEDTTSIQLNYRRAGDTCFYFFFNRDCREARTGFLTIPGTVAASVWFGENGQVLPAAVVYEADRDQTQIEIRIEEGGSLMLVTEPAVAADLETAAGANVTVNAVPTTALDLPREWTVMRQSPNALLLEFCRLRKGEGAYSDLYPILAIQEILTDENYIGPITLAFPFTTAIPLAGLQVALESPDQAELFFNGRPINNQANGYYLAKEFKLVDLPDVAVPGEQIIEIRRPFRPLAKAKSSITSLFEDLPGVELEALYLLGDFAVQAMTEPTRTNCVRLNRRFVLEQESHQAYTELVTAGYPFYAGTLILEKTFTLPADVSFTADRPAWLEFEGFRACTARVLVNGQDAGSISWAPFRVDVTGLLHTGENTLRIELTNTLRNLLGPYHRPKGEFGECWPGYGKPNLPWLGAAVDINSPLVPDWQDRREPDTIAWTESYLQVSLGISQATLFWKV